MQAIINARVIFLNSVIGNKFISVVINIQYYKSYSIMPLSITQYSKGIPMQVKIQSQN